MEPAARKTVESSQKKLSKQSKKSCKLQTACRIKEVEKLDQGMRPVGAFDKEEQATRQANNMYVKQEQPFKGEQIK